MSADSKTDLLRKIRDDVVALKDSPLYEFRVAENNLPVIGEGSHDASIIFIGEGPGFNEARQGRPFCGAAGKVLDKLLAAAGIPRESVYITNILKDRPPNNRDPLPEEIVVYGPFLDRQIEIIQPKVIATLGRYAMAYIMRKYGLESVMQPISAAHGKTYHADTLFGIIDIIPLYHPAVAVYNASTLKTLEEDFQILKKYHTAQ